MQCCCHSSCLGGGELRARLLFCCIATHRLWGTIENRGGAPGAVQRWPMPGGCLSDRPGHAAGLGSLANPAVAEP